MNCKIITILNIIKKIILLKQNEQESGTKETEKGQRRTPETCSDMRGYQDLAVTMIASKWVGKVDFLSALCF